MRVAKTGDLLAVSSYAPRLSKERAIPENAGPAYRAALGFLLFILLVGPALDALRLVRVSALPSTVLFYVTLPLLSILFGGAAVTTRRRAGRIDGIEIALLLALLWGVTRTIMVGGTALDVGGNALRVLFSLSVYRSSRLSLRHPRTRITLARRISLLGLAGVVLGVLITYWGVATGRQVYLGLSSEGAFPAIIQSLVLGSGWNQTAMLGLIVVVLAGKRGPIIAIIGTMAVYYGLFARRWRAAVAVCAILVAVVSVSLAGPTRLLARLPSPVQSRVQPFLVGAGNVDLNVATAGRTAEVEYVIDRWREEPLLLISGGGLGATILSSGGATKSTIHISPVAVVYIWGLPIGLLLYWSIGKLLVDSLITARNWENRYGLYWLLVALSYFFTTFSVFSLLQSPILWISLGALSASRSPRPDGSRPAHYDGEAVIQAR